MLQLFNLSDPVGRAVAGLLIALSFSVACGLYVLAQNSASKTLALGIGALFGTALIFLTQLYFELQPTSKTEIFPTEFTIDLQEKKIVPRTPGKLFVTQDSFNKLLPKMTFVSDDLPDINQEIVLAAMVHYILREHFDWQMQWDTFTLHTGEMSSFRALSKPEECTAVPIAEIRSQLETAGNRFAQAEHLSMFDRHLCLPPGSTIVIKGDAVVLSSPICTVSFSLPQKYLQMMMRPPSLPWDQPTPMFEGKPRFVAISAGIRATIMYAGLRAQSADKPKYEAWATRLIQGAKAFFAG